MVTDGEEFEEDEADGIVINNGSFSMKAGFGGDDGPRLVFPTVVGKPMHQSIMIGVARKDYYAGDEAMSKRGILSLKYPIEDNTISDWNNMEKILHHTFYNELKISPEEHSVLMSENALFPRSYKEEVVQILFETFNVAFAFVANQSVLALVVSGKESGIVINSGGYGATSIVPVYNGHALRDSVCKTKLNGHDLSRYMTKLLVERGYTFAGIPTVLTRDIKEKLCYIAKDFGNEMDKKEEEIEKLYELPDGQHVTIGAQRFRCPEALFKPSVIGSECDGLAESLKKCINVCDKEMKEELMQNIVFCGGNTLFDGIVERMYNEMDCTPKVYKSKYLIDGFYRRLNEKALYKDIHNLTYSYCDGISDPKRWMYAGDDRIFIDAPPHRK